MREVKIEKLNDIEIFIIRNILLDIVYLLDKFEKNFAKNFKVNSQNEGSTMGKEFFEIIKKNVDIVFKFPNTRLYETMFSSESNICTKLFMIKLENGLEKDINYLASKISGQNYNAASAARIGFFESNEYLNKNTDNEQFITDCYHTFLNREPETEGLDYWREKLDSGEYSRQDVIESGFGESEEFKNILNNYGLSAN